MTLEQIIKNLNLEVLTDKKDFSKVIPSSGYVSDMLSCVMTGADDQSIWVTLQAHNNIVAVARLLNLGAVVITEGAQPDEATINKANEEDIVLLASPEKSFNIVGRLWEMGIRD